MEIYKEVIELLELMQDRGVMLPDNPYDARNLEEALSDFLERFFSAAHQEGRDIESDFAFDRGYEDGYDIGFDSVLNN